MRELLKQALSSSGDVSIMRILTAFVVVDIMAVWTANCLIDWEIYDIPWGVASIFSIMVVGKAAQTFGERKKEDTQ